MDIPTYALVFILWILAHILSYFIGHLEELAHLEFLDTPIGSLIAIYAAYASGIIPASVGAVILFIALALSVYEHLEDLIKSAIATTVIWAILSVVMFADAILRALNRVGEITMDHITNISAAFSACWDEYGEYVLLALLMLFLIYVAYIAVTEWWDGRHYRR